MMRALLRRKLTVAAALAREDPGEAVRRTFALIRRNTLETRAAAAGRVVRYRLASRIRPLDAERLNARAAALVRLNRREAAIRDLRRAVELEPDSFPLYDQLTQELYLSGRYADSVRVYADGIRSQGRLAAATGLDRIGVRFLSGDWTNLIGSLALLDVHAKLTELGLLRPGTRVVVPKAIGNDAYLDLWRERYPVVVDDLRARGALQSLLPYLRDHASVVELADGTLLALHAAATMVERRWRAEGRPPLLSLPERDKARGRSCLAELGVPEDAWFVALHVREQPWSMRDVHNAEIGTYDLAIDAIVEHGGWVIRMGDVSMTPLPVREQVVDYALSPHRSDWMDVFLWAEGRFFVGTASGPIGVPPTFGRPCVQTNWAPFAFRHWFPDDLMIAKLHRSTRDGRYPTFAETLATPAGYAASAAELAALGVELVDNSREELRDVVVEMLDRLEGRSAANTEDEELQRRFDALTTTTGDQLTGLSRPGRAWLRAHAELLPEAGDDEHAR